MTVSRLEILVEEPSIESFLNIVIPRIAPDLEYAVYPFQDKDDLLTNLAPRLRGYRRWLPADWRILVLVDSDGKDCKALKKALEKNALDSGLTTKSSRAKRKNAYQVANRIVVQELEAWYFGDWEAVCAAFPRVPKTACSKAAYRVPDKIGNTWETFEKLLQQHGYFRDSRLPKIATAKNIARHFEPARNTADSFAQFRDLLTGF